MADILIRGMEMPKVCIDNGWYGNCPMDRSWCAQRFAPKDSTNESAHKDQWNKLPSWCPLAPLPEGHGRPIDADELMVKIKTESDFIEANFIRGRDKVSFALAVKQELYRVMEIVEKMPTIKKEADNG